MSEIINNYYYELIILMILICASGLIIMLMPIFINKKKQETLVEKIDLSDEDIKKVDETISKEQIKKELFNLYKKVEVAKSKFNYDGLKELLSENLYKEEESKLKELKNNKQKLVATNIKLQEVKVLSIKKKNNIETINAYLHVSQYDYVIDNKKKIIRGTDEAEYQIEYKITIEKEINQHFKITKKEYTGKWIKNK